MGSRENEIEKTARKMSAVIEKYLSQFDPAERDRRHREAMANAAPSRPDAAC